MSDFDREAERERLREKYEQDQKERAATERMSELLLQGATMTNAHCSECGDPIFRYDGQEFCASCERPVDRGDGNTGQTSNEGRADESDDNTSVEVTSPRDDGRVVFGNEQTDEPEGPGQQGTTGGPTERAEQPRADAEHPPGAGTQNHRGAETEPNREPGTRTAPSRGQESTGGGPRSERVDSDRARPGAVGPAGHRDGRATGVEAARASLVRTLAAFSRRAAQTEDPQRAREQLQAAREAAEALAALRR